MTKLKNIISAIHWPTKKEVANKTLLCVVVTTVLSMTVSGWSACVDYVVNWVISLF